MSVTSRQNNLFLAEDWKRVYQSFKNSNFTSYDFENLRRVMIAYLRENYPEDFNDYIESSEYLALIDLIAFLGQSLAFRIDMNARENFLELAERRESILRLAQLISYNPKRSICANGLLKVESVSTSESIIDATGRNIQNLEIVWNDMTNSNWFDQFIKVVNASMISENEFGLPQASDWVNEIWTEQYRINSNIDDLPIFPFNKTIDGKNYSFETTSTVISTDLVTKNSIIQEETPKKNNQVAFIYRDDLSGYGGVNTGFFFHFRQGDLQKQDFSLSNPTNNQLVNINDNNINNEDIWLYSLDNNNDELNLWTKVPAITGNNIIYNSLDKTIKNIYSVQTATNDSVNLIFADGVFGNLPKGAFRCYYRTSNGISYTINPRDMRGIVLNIPYISATGSAESIRFIVSLKSSVTTATASETNDEVRFNAPSTYYTQNRMITGEDYNLAPLNVSQNIAKIKSINRTSSGISRNFDIVDVTGNYSTTSIFCTDGILYREQIQQKFDFKFNSRTDIESVIVNQIQPIIKLPLIRDFYYEYYTRKGLTTETRIFNQATAAYNESTGYTTDANENITPLGSFTSSNAQYIEPGALIKFVAPLTKTTNLKQYFTTSGKLTTTKTPTTVESIWAKVVSVVGDGTANGLGKLTTGIGPLVLNVVVPTGAQIYQVIPKFLGYIPTDIQSLMIDLIFNYKNFGIKYDNETRLWNIIQEKDLNLYDAWNSNSDTTGNKLDSSWLIALETNGEKYTVTYRGLEYYFESILENRFFFDGTRKIYDSTTGKLQKDKISVLKINADPNSILGESLKADHPWQIIGNTIENNGYISSKSVKVTFWDDNDDNIVDNPDAFSEIVKLYNVIDGNTTINTDSFIFFEKYTTDDYIEDYRYISNSIKADRNPMFVIAPEEKDINRTSYSNGQLFYFYKNDTIKIYNSTTTQLITTLDYYAVVGRQDINFHYLHNADSTTRIDPSATNIIDLYILTKDYDTSFRQYLNGVTDTAPLPPSSTSLRLNYGKNLDLIKSVSDDLIYHPVNYKVLFGSMAESRLQASFKIVKNNEQVITDNDIKTRIVKAINEFFSLDNWNFGDTFYFTELSAFVMNKVTPYITTFVIVPTNGDQVYGSLQQIISSPNEIFISGATVNDIEIIPAITATRLKTSGYIVTTAVIDVNNSNIKSSTSY
jgi:hypothetical protein